MTKAAQCVLVGNGSSALDRELGGAIDSCETVVRFNLYQTKGYEPHVGTRTDIWFNVNGRKAGAWRLQHTYARVYVHTWVKDPAKCELLRDFRETFPDVAKVDHALVEEMSDYAGTKYRAWSTGALALWMMRKEHPHVALTGFDWWENRAKHHYCDGQIKGRLHQPDIEKQFIDQLVVEGGVSFL